MVLLTYFGLIDLTSCSLLFNLEKLQLLRFILLRLTQLTFYIKIYINIDRVKMTLIYHEIN